MPKPTFFNLPEEKREKIIKAAIDEFAEYGLENASINRIVANSGIAKGSFYQYFEDKQDVFRYLLTVLEHEKMEYFKDKHPESRHMDAFEYFRWMVKTGMEFNSVYPRLVQAISRVMFNEGLYYQNFANVRERSTQSLQALIRQAIQNGEVDPSVDVDLAVMIMETWSNTISSYILNEGMKQQDIVQWVRSAETQEKIDKLLYVMEYGLRRTESDFAKNFQERNRL
ncbi:TetR/AcrR family transcriptional regulator [uncultured Chloroflexus sp.]|uniref:TetR/AcrR family transcriptional regulator n=1 Tax=uncultured Chloroflexus sp. TaxID=214040 RepID=UPI00260AFBB9|nr:TetR/AcrR family transcriptional regulator [uncultured Chloroflexus sp.]